MGKFINLIGERFGRLVVVEQLEDYVRRDGSRQHVWRCICDCGNEIHTTTMNLRSGDTKSCGCYKHDSTVARMTTHGESDTRLHSIWKAMRKRCNNPHDSAYNYYGGKGIKVCEEWDDFTSFKEWAMANGYSDDLTIDRIDSDKDYCPQNCRWSNFKDQCNNRTNNCFIEYNGERLTIAQWSERLGIKYTTLYRRIKCGKSPEEALTV